MNLCVLSCCYEKPELSAILRESCDRAGLTLGMCEASAANHVWPGDMRLGKMQAAYEHLVMMRETRIFSHALWADGFDSFMQATEPQILDRWNCLDSPPMVFSGEKNCWPDPDKLERYRATDSPYRSLNAGTWMGQVGYLCDVIGDILHRSEGTGETDDQRLWTDAFLDGYLPGAIVDSDRLIFQTMWGTEINEVQSPCVIHYNGGIWRNPEDRRYIEHWERVKGGAAR